MGNQLTWAGVLIVASFIGGLFLGKSTKDKKPIGNTTVTSELVEEFADRNSEEKVVSDQTQVIEEQLKEIERLSAKVAALTSKVGDGAEVVGANAVATVATNVQPGWSPESGSSAVSEAVKVAPQNSEADSGSQEAIAQPEQTEPVAVEPTKPKPPTVAELEEQLVSGGPDSLQTLASLRWSDLPKTLEGSRPISESLIEKFPEGDFSGSSSLGSYLLKVSKSPKRNQSPVVLSIDDQPFCNWEWAEVMQPEGSEQGFVLECGDQTLQIYPSLGSNVGYRGTAFEVDSETGSAKSNHPFELSQK